MDKLTKHLREAWEQFEATSYSPKSKNKVLIVVDIQEEYSSYMGFSIRDFCKWLNKAVSRYSGVIIFWNGPELGMSSKEDIVSWYYEYGLRSKNIERIKWHDKSYAFFRHCIDSGEAFNNTVKLVKYMYKNGINDSRDIGTEVWDTLVKSEGLETTRELLEFQDDCIHIPDLMEVLAGITSEIDICGGGLEECLAEIKIALSALEKKYTSIDQWIY